MYLNHLLKYKYQNDRNHLNEQIFVLIQLIDPLFKEKNNSIRNKKKFTRNC
jgi:hypothetical protein